MKPSISVCLTAFERAHSIGGTIESMLQQDHSDFELLIQDNASTDGTEAVCRAYAAQDPRIRYERNASNIGMPGNLNAAIARARAPLIANIHDGDLYRPDLLRRWADALARQDAAFVFNQLEQVDSAGRHVRVHTHPFGPRIDRTELVRYMLERFDSPVWGTVMARRSAYSEVGPFDERYSYLADVEMWMRLNLRYAAAYVAEPLIRITPHEDDRPYAFVNWGLERALVSMRETTADALFGKESGERKRYQRRLIRMRRKRWTRLAVTCLRRGRSDIFREGMRVFWRDGDAALRGVALLGWPVGVLGKTWRARR